MYLNLQVLDTTNSVKNQELNYVTLVTKIKDIFFSNLQGFAHVRNWTVFKMDQNVPAQGISEVGV